MVNLRKTLAQLLPAGLTAVVGFFALLTPYVAAQDTYGSGVYGACTYNECGIALTSDSTINLNVTPLGGSTTCTVASETVGVTTGSSTGYNVTLSDSNTNNSMAGSNGGTINATSGTYASPAALTANTWGYRVDGRGSFGAGPTSAVTNGSIPARTFARTPASGSADTIISSSSAANPRVDTNVWYGLCASSSLPSGTYSDAVIYTAVVNN